MRRYLRKIFMGLATVLGIRKLGFFIPYRYAAQIPAGKDRAAYNTLAEMFDRRVENFHHMLSLMNDFSHDLQAIGSEPPPAPRWEQDWFPGLDGAVAYTMVRTRQPKRLVEVGSGHSTRFLARAITDGELTVAITTIDPAPRADIATLDVTIIRQTIQEAGLSAFAELTSGDIVSMDSSHILMPGSDVDMMLNVVLPALPAGVLVHIHDIFLPGDYPASWQWRGYNEQLGIAALLHSGGYDILWSSHYVRTRMASSLTGALFDTIQPPEGGYESSLWLRKR